MDRAGVWLEWKGSRLNYIVSADSSDTAEAGSIFASGAEAKSAYSRVK
jgi:hypothetical protein